MIREKRVRSIYIDTGRGVELRTGWGVELLRVQHDHDVDLPATCLLRWTRVGDPAGGRPKLSV